MAGADHAGHLATVSLGSAATLPARIERLRSQNSLVIADLPAGPTGYDDLRSLSAARPPGELLIVLPRVDPAPGNELLWVGLAGLGGAHTLTSQTTNQRGLVSTVIVPTILTHLGLPVPSAMRGKPIALDGSFMVHLRSLRARLLVVYRGGCRRFVPARRVGAPGAGPIAARARRPHTSARPRVGGARRRARAAVDPRRRASARCAEKPAAASDSRCSRSSASHWRAHRASGALAARAARPHSQQSWRSAADALTGTQLLVRSLLGPDPALGVRFYGIGNELKSGLAVLVFAAVAAALYPSRRFVEPP